jgi:hypothetical protein
MRRLAVLLSLSCLAIGPCGESSGGDDDFRTDGSDPPTSSDDTGTPATEEEQTGGGGNNPYGFVTWTLACDGDNQEYTWTASAETDYGASVVYVELDPETAGWDTFYLDAQDGEGRLWESQTTELLTDRGCDSTAILRWYALANGGGDATDDGYYP